MVELLLVIFILLAIIFFTANNKYVRYVAASLFSGGVFSFITMYSLVIACYQTEIIGYSFCGEIVGLIRIAITSIIVGLIAMCLTFGILYFKNGKVVIK